MRGALLGRDFFERLIEVEDISSTIDALKDTEYREDIEHTTLEERSAKTVEEALKRNIARNFRKVQTFVSKKAEELLSLSLARWDLHNIKTILRGKHIKIDDEEIIASFVPAGELDELLLLELVRQPTVKDCIDLLATCGIEYAKPLTAEVPAYSKEKNLMILETALDRYYFKHALKRLSGKTLNVRLVREIILATVDITNIMTLLRVQDVNFRKKVEEIKKRSEEEKDIDDAKEKTEGEEEEIPVPPGEESEETEELRSKEVKEIKLKEPKEFLNKMKLVFDPKTGKRINEEEVKKAKEEEEKVKEEKEIKKMVEELILTFFIPGGRAVDKNKFLALAQNDEPSDVIEGLSATTYGRILQEAEIGYLERGRVSILERRLEQFLITKAVSMYQVDLLSIGVILGYVWAKFNEVVNLRIIMRGKAVGMPMENIKEELVLV